MKKNKKDIDSDNPSILEVVIALTLALAIIVGLPAVVGALIGGIIGALIGGIIAIAVFFAAWEINKRVQGERYYSEPVLDLEKSEVRIGDGADSGWGPDPSSVPSSDPRMQDSESEPESGLGQPKESDNPAGLEVPEGLDLPLKNKPKIK